jgi:hypothetical protein
VDSCFNHQYVQLSPSRSTLTHFDADVRAEALPSITKKRGLRDATRRLVAFFSIDGQNREIPMLDSKDEKLDMKL